MLSRRVISFLSYLTLFAGIPAVSQTQSSSDIDTNSIQDTADNESFCHSRYVTARDDAFHYKYWQGTPYDGAYTEWWYFNLYDKKQDLQAIFSYQVVDPANVTGQGTAFIAAAAYKGGDIVNTFDRVPLPSFAASYSVANVVFGANKISVIGPYSYRINGASANGRVTWDLEYDRESDPWFAADHAHVALDAWEQMSWLVYMPRAHVTGTVTVDGHSYDVESSGYHDHNWGEWNLSQVRWNWAEYSEPGLSFDLGDFIGNPNGRAAIDIKGHRVVFPASQYKLVHTKWAYDSLNKTYYPIQSVFTGDNGSIHVSVTMDTVKTDPLPVFPGQVIYEQTTHFNGVVTAPDDENREAEIKFEGSGFKEYTAATDSSHQSK